MNFQQPLLQSSVSYDPSEITNFIPSASSWEFFVYYPKGIMVRGLSWFNWTSIWSALQAPLY